MRKLSGGILPFLFLHIFCCGALLIFLVSSGTLLFLSREASNRVFLLPALAVTGFLMWISHRHTRHCSRKDKRGFKEDAVTVLLYLSLSVLLSILFLIYIFIPWWIPGYTGGMLLP